MWRGSATDADPGLLQDTRSVGCRHAAACFSTHLVSLDTKSDSCASSHLHEVAHEAKQEFGWLEAPTRGGV